MGEQPNRQPASDQNSFSETWNRLTPTLKGALDGNRKGKRATFTTYCHLWHLCGGRAGAISVTAKDIAAALNVDERTARGDLDILRDAGLVDFHDRDRDTGQYELYVCSPEAPGQVRRVEANPQAELFEEPPADAAPEPPEIVAGIFARISPHSQQRSLWNAENSPVADIPAGISAQKPTMDHGTIEDGAIGPSPVLEINKSLPLSPAEKKRATDVTDFPGDPTLAAMADREAMEKLQALTAKPHASPPANDPVERNATEKSRIVVDLVGWAGQFTEYGGGRMDRKRAAQIADHVLIDGLPEGRLWLLTDEVRQEWLADPKITSPVGVFDYRLEKMLTDLGIATRAKSKRRAK